MKNLFTIFFVFTALILGINNLVEAQIATHPENDTICLGSDAEFIVVADNLPATNFEWQSLIGVNWSGLVDNDVYSGINNDTLQLIAPSSDYADTSYRCIAIEGLNSEISDIVQVVFNPDFPASLTIEVITNDTICLGDEVSFVADPINGGLSPFFQWFIDGNDVINNNDTLTTNALTSEHEIYCLVISSLPCPLNNYAVSDTIEMTVLPDLPASVTIEVIPNNTSICSGDEVSFAAIPVNGGPSPHYQWFFDGGDIGVPLDTDTITTDTMTVNHDVHCLLSSSLPCPENNFAFSDTIEMTVYEALSTNVSIDQEICSGENPDELSSNPSGGPDNQYNFQWQDSIPNGNWEDVPGEESETYLPDPLFTTTFFRLILNNTMGCNEHISDPIEVTVYDALSTSVSGDQQICIGDIPAELSSGPEGGPTPADYIFQWQDSIPNGNWEDLPNDTLENYEAGSLLETTFFRVIVNNEIGCNEHISDPIEVTVFDALSTNVSDDQEICNGDTPNGLTSSPSGGLIDIPAYLFQWQDSIPNGNWEDISGEESETYQPDPLYETTFFRVILNNEIGCTEHLSDPVGITVYDALSTNMSANQEICTGEIPDELSSGPEGGPTPPGYLFQWQDSIPNGSWEDFPGGNSQTYEPGILLETTFFRVIVNNEIGCPEHISDSIKIVGIPSDTASISIEVSENPICDNEIVIFSISDSLNGGENPGFKWYLNDVEISTSNTWSSLVNNSDEVYIEMNSNAKCVIDNPVNSETITMEVNASPIILNSGDLVPKPVNDPVVLICVDSLETNTYSWFVNNEEISMANEKFFYPPKYDLTFNYNSEYYVMLENEFCFSNSNSYTYALNKSGLFEESEVFIVYPNPSSGIFSLALNNEIVPEDFESCTIRILDYTGKVVFYNEISEMTQNIELSGVQRGIYLLEVKISESHHQIRKLIIE